MTAPLRPGPLARAAIALAIAASLGACEAAPSGGAPAAPSPGASPGGAAALPAGSRLGAFSVVPGSALVTGRAEHTSHVVGSYLYVLGGLSGVETSPGVVERVALDGVERASVGSDGALGPFAEVERTRLTTPRFGHCSAVVGSYLYVLGGLDRDFVTLATVERAVINTNGVLGPFAPVPEASLTLPRYGATCLVVGKYLYVLGGGGERQNAAERAPILDDGTLGPFEPASAAQLAAGRVFASAHRIGDFVYLLGGDEEDRSERAPVGPDGTLGSFSLQGSASLTVQRGSATGLRLGDALYLIGGWSGRVERTLERAPVGASGALGPFSALAEPALSAPSMRHTSHVVGRSLYVIGGSEDGRRALRRVERSVIE